MKKLFLMAAACSLILTSGSTFASYMDKKSACSPLMDACKTAGYMHGMDGKDLWDDCVEKLMDGKTVHKVSDNSVISVESKKASLCKNFHEDKEQWMKKWNKSHGI